MRGKSLMYADGESYCDVVPTKQPNKREKSPAEIAEGRPQIKENTRQPNLGPTPNRESRPSGLERVREAARKNGKLKFTALLHHVSIDLLQTSYQSLKKEAALGTDGITWEEYGRNLEARLANCMDEPIAEHIKRNRREESEFRKPTGRNVHSESRTGGQGRPVRGRNASQPDLGTGLSGF